jgi:hypothetical protein
MTSRHSAAALLSRQGRPPGAVSAVLEARDPRIIRRHPGLHRERLIEQAIDQRRAVDRVEQLLVEEEQWPLGI